MKRQVPTFFLALALAATTGFASPGQQTSTGVEPDKPAAQQNLVEYTVENRIEVVGLENECPNGDQPVRTVKFGDTAETTCVHDHNAHSHEASFSTTPPPPAKETPAAQYPIACFNSGHDGHRVQAVYVYASGQPDRSAEVIPEIRNLAIEADSAVQASAQKTGGHRQIRWTTRPDCKVHVAVTAIPANSISSFRETINRVKEQGHNYPNRRYILFVDDATYCGLGEWMEDDRPAHVGNYHNTDESFYARVDRTCWYSSAVLHELGHTLGAVQDSAPNSTREAHCSDAYEVMCYQDASGIDTRVMCPQSHEALLDCQNNDYFHTNPAPSSYLATHWNMASSKYLLHFPVNSPIPPPPPCATDPSIPAEDPNCHTTLPSSPFVSRLSGTDRTHTATLVSQRIAPGTASTVIIARNDSYADALTAGPLAKHHQAPILLTSPHSIPASTVNELNRLSPSTAYVIGGVNAISYDVENQLRSRGMTVTRIAGSDRYDTAAQISAQIPESDYVMVASTRGAGWPDAVTASWTGSIMNSPVLLVDGPNVPQETKDALIQRSPNEIYMIGADASEARPTLENYTTTAWGFWGVNRFETSGSLVNTYEWNTERTLPGTWIATGNNWPDALVAAPAAALDDSALILVPGQTKMESLHRFSERGPSTTRLIVVGGTPAISEAVEYDVAWALAGQ